jgi:hypothetical protein
MNHVPDRQTGLVQPWPVPENDELVHEAPAIVGCRTPSALAHAADDARPATDGRNHYRTHGGPFCQEGVLV